jgi:uncharacterized membrane protein YhaH (DUF805 family)
MNSIGQFLFPKRLHRLGFLLRYLVVVIADIALDSPETRFVAFSWWIPNMLLLSYYAFFVILPRLRDLNMRWWWMLAAFIPVIAGILGIILFFRSPSYCSTDGVTKCTTLP